MNPSKQVRSLINDVEGRNEIEINIGSELGRNLGSDASLTDLVHAMNQLGLQTYRIHRVQIWKDTTGKSPPILSESDTQKLIKQWETIDDRVRKMYPAYVIICLLVELSDFPEDVKNWWRQYRLTCGAIWPIDRIEARIQSS